MCNKNEFQSQRFKLEFFSCLFVTKNVFDNNGLDILATQGLHRNYTDASRL